MEEHERFLRDAIALSKSAMERGNEPFGAVLVKDGEIILRAENSVFTGHDMTNHAGRGGSAVSSPGGQTHQAKPRISQPIRTSCGPAHIR